MARARDDWWCKTKILFDVQFGLFRIEAFCEKKTKPPRNVQGLRMGLISRSLISSTTQVRFGTCLCWKQVHRENNCRVEVVVISVVHINEHDSWFSRKNLDGAVRFRVLPCFLTRSEKTENICEILHTSWSPKLSLRKWLSSNWLPQ